MQLIAKQRGRGGVLLLVLVVDGRAGKPKEQRVRQSALNGGEHVTKGGAVCLIDDEHHTLGADDVQVGFLDGISINPAHLVQGGHDEGGVLVLEQRYQRGSTGGIFHGDAVATVAFVVLQRLRAQLHTVEEEHYLVGVVGVCDKLRGLEAGNRLARAGGVPDVTAELVAAVPVVTVHTVSDTRGCVVLVRTHGQQVARGSVGDSVEANELVRHRNRQ